MIRKFVGVVGIVVGLVILAVRMARGVIPELTLGALLGSIGSFAFGFSVLFALDRKIRKMVAGWGREWYDVLTTPDTKEHT